MLRTHVPDTWEVEFPKRWYDLDWWYDGEGHIKQRLTSAFLSGVQTVSFYAVPNVEMVAWL